MQDNREEIKKEVSAKSIKKQTYNVKEVLELIDKVSVRVLKPDKVRTGDIFLDKGGGSKTRPHMVISVRKKDVVAVGLTTTNNEKAVCDISDRFNHGKICSHVGTFNKDWVKKRFIGVYDGKRPVSDIRREIKETLRL